MLMSQTAKLRQEHALASAQLKGQVSHYFLKSQIPLILIAILNNLPALGKKMLDGGDRRGSAATTRRNPGARIQRIYS